jgi:hypothetical protein
VAGGHVAGRVSSARATLSRCHHPIADGVYSPDFAAELGESQPKCDAAQSKVELSFRFLKKFDESESSREPVKSAWTYAVGTQHNTDASPERARRTVVTTTIALVEIANLISEALSSLELYLEYGFYKCPTCSKMTLVIESWYDGISGGNLLMCTSCSWTE